MQQTYTSLTDSQWAMIGKIIGKKRKSRHNFRTVVDTILWMNYTGVQWREVSKVFPKWQTVYYHFRQLKLSGAFESILDTLVVKKRVQEGKDPSPCLLAIDSQSVKVIQFVGEETGIDGNKKINGRKRTILVDKLGLPFSVKVTAANVSDNEAGILALQQLKGKVPRLEKIAADSGYKNKFVTEAQTQLGCKVEIAQRPESVQGFIPEKNRWQVERAFSFLNFRRRLFKDVEKTIESAEAMLQIAFISFIINTL
jgi:transposase